MLQEKGVCYDKCVLLAKLLVFSPLHFVSKGNLACYSRYLQIFQFCNPVLYDENYIFFWCQLYKVLQIIIEEPFNFSFFSISCQGIDLDYCDIEWFAWKRTELILSFLRLYPSTEFQTLLLTMRATPFLLRDSCPQQQLQWSSELNLPILVHFRSLIPKMLMYILFDHFQFTLIHGLTFQVSLRYCSLQHQALLPPPVTSTTGHCFRFGPSGKSQKCLNLIHQKLVFSG